MSDAAAAAIAFAAGMLTLFSPTMVRIIRLVIPWYMVFFIILIMILMGSYLLGGPGDSAKSFMGTYYRPAIILIIIVSVMIFLAGLGQVVFGGGGSDGDVTTGPADTADAPYFINALLHPQVLGMLALLGIAATAVVLMGKSR